MERSECVEQMDFDVEREDGDSEFIEDLDFELKPHNGSARDEAQKARTPHQCGASAFGRAPPKNSQPRRRISVNQLEFFKVGETYSNDQIRFSLDVENLGGIRPALDAQGHVRHVAIMTAGEDSGKMRVENPYVTELRGTSLPTRQGRTGDQELTGRNKRLVEQYIVRFRSSAFSYRAADLSISRVTGAAEHYQERQVDSRGNLRTVWLFELRIHEKPEVVRLLMQQEFPLRCWNSLAGYIRSAPQRGRLYLSKRLVAMKQP